MRKIILGLFIILFCFSMGIGKLQEEELSKEERAILEKGLEFVRKQKEIVIRIFSLYEEIEKLEKELKIIEELERQNTEKIGKIMPDVYKLLIEVSKPEEKDVYDPNRLTDDYEHRFSWLDKYTDPTKADKLQEENDRLEDLLRELRNERSSLEWDMIRHRSEIESSFIEASYMFMPYPWDDFWLYPYYPTYSKKTDRTNYEPLLFTLCTDSKGKMDWTKYGWLKILLRNK